MPSPLGMVGIRARASDRDALGERERAVHLLSRFAFGPSPRELARVLELGVEAWLDEQLRPVDEAELGGRLAGFESLELDAAEIYARYVEPIPDGTSAEERKRIVELRGVPSLELQRAVSVRAVYARGQLREVLTDFWRNHFNVSFTKGAVAYQLVPDWDRNVLRAHAFDPFGELLAATAHHPAMLHYLDNASSRRPPTGEELSEIERQTRRSTGSRAAGRLAADLALQRGLNENYARELLELHTLGVDNVYKQKDVVALAEILTGWTWRPREEGWAFEFRGDLHVQGNKRFLQQHVQGELEHGQEEGQEVLALLAGHPGTADHMAWKLARHFVRDDPPKKLVGELSSVFRKEDGDPRALLRAIAASGEFWSRATFRAKFKTPQEFVFSALRATESEVGDWDATLEAFAAMGQPIYRCEDPTGWYDTAEAWLDPGVLALRWKFASDLAHGRLEGVRISERVFAEVADDVPVRAWSTHLAARVLPGGVGIATQLALDRAVASSAAAEPDALRRRLLSLLLGSPEFQRQ